MVKYKKYGAGMYEVYVDGKRSGCVIKVGNKWSAYNFETGTDFKARTRKEAVEILFLSR